MFYMLATITPGGFIQRVFNGATVHRETRYSQPDVTGSFLGFTTAKAARHSDQLILKIGEDGGVCEIWAAPEHEAEVRERLRIWSGCYGAWPLRKLTEEV